MDVWKFGSFINEYRNVIGEWEFISREQGKAEVENEPGSNPIRFLHLSRRVSG